MTPELSLPIQTAWLIPLYGFIGMLVSLPWACGWFRRDAHRPAAYLNILLTLLAFAHGSLILQEVYQSGPVDLAFPWLSVADLELNISFSLSLTNLLDTRGNRFALGSPFLIRTQDQITPLQPRSVRLGFDLAF